MNTGAVQRERKQTLQRTKQGSEPKKGGDAEAFSKLFFFVNAYVTGR